MLVAHVKCILVCRLKVCYICYDECNMNYGQNSIFNLRLEVFASPLSASTDIPLVFASSFFLFLFLFSESTSQFLCHGIIEFFFALHCICSYSLVHAYKLNIRHVIFSAKVENQISNKKKKRIRSEHNSR